MQIGEALAQMKSLSLTIYGFVNKNHNEKTTSRKKKTGSKERHYEIEIGDDASDTNEKDQASQLRAKLVEIETQLSEIKIHLSEDVKIKQT